MSQGTFSHTQLERPIQAYCSLMELIKKIVCRCSVPEISSFGMVLFFSSYFWTHRRPSSLRSPNRVASCPMGSVARKYRGNVVDWSFAIFAIYSQLRRRAQDTPMYDSPLAPYLEVLLARDHRHGLATSLFHSSNGDR